MYLYNDNFIVHTCAISKKKIKCVAEQKILTVEELCRNVLSKKCVFIFVITLRNW